MEIVAAPDADSYILLAVRVAKPETKEKSTQTALSFNCRIAQVPSIAEEIMQGTYPGLKPYQATYMKLHWTCMPNEKVIEAYTEWAKAYDMDMSPGPGRYNGPLIIKRIMNDYYSNYCMEARSRLKIMDLAAGTGLVGVELAKAGYQHIDALEPSKGMLEVLLTKGVYEKIFHKPFGYMPISEIRADTYDALVCCGGFGESHIPVRGLDEILRIVRPGGMICILIQEKCLAEVDVCSKGKLMRFMHMITAKGLWIQVQSNLENDYVFNETGLSFCFQKMEI